MFRQLIILIFLGILYITDLYAEKNTNKNTFNKQILSVTGNCNNIENCFNEIQYGYNYVVRITWKPYKDNGAYYPTCSGVLIDKDLVLTAAHCFSWNNTPSENIKNMRVNFKYNSSTELTVDTITAYGIYNVNHLYDIEEIVESGYDLMDKIDYAIIRIKWRRPNIDVWNESDRQKLLAKVGNNFDDLYGKVHISNRLAYSNDQLTIVQHPLIYHYSDNNIQSNKRLSTGILLSNNNEIQNNIKFKHNAPTYFGSSGSGILNNEGNLVGIHIGGKNTDTADYENYGILIEKIARVSSIIHIN